MKKKEIIGAIIIALVFVGGAAGYKLANSNETTATVKKEIDKSIVKDLTGDKSKLAASKIDYKKLYTVANKEGNTSSNRSNFGLMAQQEKWVYFADNGLCIALTDLKTGWKKINNDKPKCIEVLGEWIYYIDDTTGQLIKIKADGSNKKVLVQKRVLNYKIQGDWVYFNDYKQLCKMKTDGTERTLISENECYLTEIYGNYIYFGKNNDKGLWRICEDGSDEKKLVDNCTMMILKGEWIFFKDFNNAISKVKLDGSSQTKVIEEPATAFGIEGDYIYYVADEFNSVKELRRAKLDGTEKIKVYDLGRLPGISTGFVINISSDNVCLYAPLGNVIYKFKK